jgi:hypothetical protein
MNNFNNTVDSSNVALLLKIELKPEKKEKTLLVVEFSSNDAAIMRMLNFFRFKKVLIGADRRSSP